MKNPLKWVHGKIVDPKVAMLLHGIAAIVWFIAAFPIMMYLATSIVFLVFVSVYAVVTGHWSSFQAARTEVLQAEADERFKLLLDRVEEAVQRLEKFDPDHEREHVDKKSPN